MSQSGIKQFAKFSANACVYTSYPIRYTTFRSLPQCQCQCASSTSTSYLANQFSDENTRQKSAVRLKVCAVSYTHNEASRETINFLIRTAAISALKQNYSKIHCLSCNLSICLWNNFITVSMRRRVVDSVTNITLAWHDPVGRALRGICPCYDRCNHVLG